MHVSFRRLRGGDRGRSSALIIPKGSRHRAQHQPGQHAPAGRKWLRLYRSLGGEIITLGTDAHTPRSVGCAIREGQALLREPAAFRALLHLLGRRKPVWHAFVIGFSPENWLYKSIPAPFLRMGRLI
ncbi:MAG: hypothetical protein ACLU38_09730 [Dysosmobacter sp.]